MAETSWPFHDGTDGTPVLEDQWSYMARQWAAPGVVGAPGDANLQVFANSSGREVHVRSGRACVRGHWYRLDAQTTLTIAANASGNPRIDRVVLRLDPSADEVTAEVLQGTPAASPSAPALTTTDTGVFEVSLAQVAVANGAASISSGNVTDERTFTDVPYTPALSSRRPASPVKGQRIYETDTGLDKVWNGSAWVMPKAEAAESWTALTVIAPWVQSGTDAAKLKWWREGDIVRFRGYVYANTAPYITGPIESVVVNTGQLPAPAVSRHFPVVQQGNGSPNVTFARVETDGALKVIFWAAGSGTSPMVWFDGCSYTV
jgi:hypothetical protein